MAPPTVDAKPAEPLPTPPAQTADTTSKPQDASDKPQEASGKKVKKSPHADKEYCHDLLPDSMCDAKDGLKNFQWNADKFGIFDNKSGFDIFSPTTVPIKTEPGENPVWVEYHQGCIFEPETIQICSMFKDYSMMGVGPGGKKMQCNTLDESIYDVIPADFLSNHHKIVYKRTGEEVSDPQFLALMGLRVNMGIYRFSDSPPLGGISFFFPKVLLDKAGPEKPQGKKESSPTPTPTP